MERDTSYDDKLQEIEREIRDNVLLRLPGDDERLEEVAGRLNKILTSLMVTQRGFVNPHPGLHPSSIGGCKRLMYYSLKAVERKPLFRPSAEAIMRMAASSSLHDMIQNKIEKLPQKILKIENEVWIPSTSEAAVTYNIRGKSDTLISCLGNDGELRPFLILEYKFVSPAQFSRIRSPEEKHLKQGMTYLFGFNAPAVAFVYVNKDSMDKKTYVRMFDTDIWREVCEEIRTIQKAVADDEMPKREVNFYVCKNICRYSWTCKPPLRSRLV